MASRKDLSNPFSNDVVTTPDQSIPVDVRSIHQEVFELCQHVYEDVAERRGSQSILIFGEAGCGKTHLLSRFRRWATEEGDQPPSRSPAVFTSVRMETSPQQIWRHLRLRLAEALTRRNADGSCALDSILERFAARHHGDLTEAFDVEHIEDLGLDLIRILEQYKEGTHRRLCRAWLAGEGLSDSDLQILQLPHSSMEELEEDFAESQAMRNVKALIRLSAPSPVVFCFDQLEALGISAQPNSFALFSRMGSSLMDTTTNCLVISTVLVTFLTKLQETSNRPDYQRIRKHKADLKPISFDQAKDLVSARIAGTPGLEGETPIQEKDLQAFYQRQNGACNPRQLIHEARRLFEIWQGLEPKPVLAIEDFISSEYERLWSESQTRTTQDVDTVLAHGLPVALQLLGRNAQSTGTGLILPVGQKKIQLVFANQTDMKSLAAGLRRVLAHRRPETELCVLRDSRQPISAGAHATHQRIEELQHSGGRVIRVEGEVIAAIDAMRRLLALATSGDLSQGGQTVEAKTVREWLQMNMPLSIAKLAAEILQEEESPQHDPREEALLEIVRRVKILPAEEVARATSLSMEQIESYARKHPLHISWFGGNRAVVGQAVEPASLGGRYGN